MTFKQPLDLIVQFVMSKRLSMLICFCLFKLTISSQSIGMEKWAVADQLKAERSYTESIITYRLALPHLLNESEFEKYYDARISIAYNYLDLYDYKLASEEIIDCIDHYETKYTGPYLIEYPKAFQCAGNIFGDQQFYSEALTYNSKALDAYEKVPDEKERKKYTSFIYNNISTIYKSKRIIDTALVYAEKSLLLKKEILGPEHKSTIKTLRNISGLHQDWGNLDEGIIRQKEILKITQDNNDLESMAISYSDLSELYQRKKEYKLSKEYIGKSIELFVSLYGPDHIEVAYTYHQMGNALETELEHKASLDWYHKSKEMKRQIYGKPTYTEALTTMNIAKAHNFIADQKLDKDNPIESIDQSRRLSKMFYQETHELFSQTITSDHMRYIELWLSEGNCYLAEGDSLRAHDVFSKAYKRAYSKGTEKSYDRALSCLNLARTETDVDSAILLCQKGLWELSNGWSYTGQTGSPNPEQVFYDHWSLILLNKKAGLFINKIALKNIHDQIAVRNGLNTVIAGDRLLGDTRASMLTKSAKIGMSQECHSMYGKGLDFVYLTEENPNMDYALEFMEKNKGLALLEALHTGRRLSESLIPDSLSFKIKKLNDQISTYSTQQKVVESKDKLYTLNARLFDLNNELDSIMKYIRSTYPIVEKLEKNKLVLSLNQLQSELNPKEYVYEYFHDEKQLFVLKVSSNDARLFKIDNADFEEELDSLLLIINDNDIALNKSNSSKIWNQYNRLANRLFKILLPDFMEADQLLIIPDGQLNYLPFEVLITNPNVSKKINYSTPDYLIKQVKIRYAFSASLQFASIDQSGPTKKGLLSVAPSYIQNQDGFMSSRSGFSSLKYIVDEVESISSIMGGEKLINDNATKSMFSNKAPDYKYLHMAMHAYTHDEDPMLSGLVFADNNDPQEDILHAYELYNMNLPSDLVVLSACNTGLGQYKKGEGIMSLARAFRHAGSKDIVMSLWQANDEATKDIMTNFYKNLKDGLDKSSALRKAKIKYLDSGSNSFPHFWAAFVLVGDDEPINTAFLKWDMLLILLVFGLIIFFGIKRIATAYL